MLVPDNEIVVTTLENKCNFIQIFFVLMHFTGQKKKSNGVIHSVYLIDFSSPLSRLLRLFVLISFELKTFPNFLSPISQIQIPPNPSNSYQVVGF